MFSRQVLALAIAAAVLAGCGTSAVPGANAFSGTNASSALHSPLALALPDSTPHIKKVSPIQAEQTQTITIKGKGFGKLAPFNGDGCCIQIIVTNPACYYYYPYDSDTWRAGYEGSGNEVTLDVTHWSAKKIVIAGFTGLYGYGCWELVSGQPITINIWNAQTNSGPATYNGTVQ